jgi:hypothetical protein
MALARGDGKFPAASPRRYPEEWKCLLIRIEDGGAA